MALTLALTGLGGALLVVLLVNVAFQSRFDSFVAQQQTDREAQLLSVVTASYVDAGGWDGQALAVLAPATVMSGAEVTVFDGADRRIWSSADSAMSAAMGQRHRQLMDVGPLGEARRLPVVVAGEQVGTVTVAVPQGGLPSGEQEFLDSVNRLLLAGVALAGAVAVAAGAVLARRATRPV
ncbi:MAG: two-component sensor histidine kinase, partial [Geodermatophilaceae bacterium]|nr:two-component sensor histidine kinase [Geodermatophilaceae bacterium]